jgi:hypothetical protein
MTGLPLKAFQKDEDPFDSLNNYIQNVDAVSDKLYEELQSIKLSFHAAPEQIFIIGSLSEVICPKPKSVFGVFSELTVKQIHELQDQKGEAHCFLLVYIGASLDSLYVSGLIDQIPFEEFRFPHIVIPSGEREVNNDIFFMNIKNFVNNLKR